MQTEKTVIYNQNINIIKKNKKNFCFGKYLKKIYSKIYVKFCTKYCILHRLTNENSIFCTCISKRLFNDVNLIDI